MECGIVLLGLIVLAVPVAALSVAIWNLRRLRDLTARFVTLQAELGELRGRPLAPRIEAPTTPPAAVEKPAEEPLPAPSWPTEPEPVTPPPRPAVEAASPTEAPPTSASPPAAAAEPPPLSLPETRAWSFSDLERSLGARMPVWIGAIALALAAAFLVKLSFERGWLGPPVRVALGVIFGIVLLVGGEALRKGSAWVAQGLSAAGIASLFVAIYAGVNLYGLIPAVAGFALLALTTAVAVALSLRQGVMVAVLGLVGGFLTPYLVSTGETRFGTLFLYLFLLQAGLLAVTRRRGWWLLAGLSFGGGLVWLAIWLAGPFELRHAPGLGLFLIASVALFAASALVRGSLRAWGGQRQLGAITWWPLLGGLVALGTLTVAADFQTFQWLYLGLLSAGVLVLARRDSSFFPLAWLAAPTVAFLLILWIAELQPEGASRFLWTVLALGTLFAGGSYAAHHASPVAGRWCFLSAASGVGALLIAYWGAEEVDLSLPWGAISLGLAALYTAAAMPLARRRREAPELELPIAGLAVGATTLVSLAVPMELERSWLTVAWALEVTALVWLSERLRVPVLRTLAWIVAGLVVVRLLLNPAVLEYPIGVRPVFNWLLYGYGVPVLAFAAGAYLAYRHADRPLSEALQWGALGLGFALVTLQVRQYFHPGDLGAEEFFLAEWGAFSVVWLLLAWALLWANGRWPMRSLSWGGAGLLGLSLVQALLAQGLAANPLWSHHPVSETPIWNALLWVYGAPAALLLLSARELRAPVAKWLAPAAAVGSLALLFGLITLEVRQAFQGSFLDRGEASNAEQYAYSAAWVLLGTALLVAGILMKGRLLRLASLAIMLLAAGKVFLYDVGQLGGFYRVLSFLGLGASLLLLAYLYQRFVFRDQP